MKLDEIIAIHKDRLNTLDPKKDFSNWKFNLAIGLLIISFPLGYKYGWGIVFIGFIAYAILAYKSVKW